jgi:hypothetical protein
VSQNGCLNKRKVFFKVLEAEVQDQGVRRVGVLRRPEGLSSPCVLTSPVFVPESFLLKIQLILESKPTHMTSFYLITSVKVLAPNTVIF